ncbi:MAG TPA: hypothetical protein VLT86_08235 [Vicinamibacterales bacterium]|nr:hypothetical protein [Vicinamibacterales bacterium]
MTPLELSGSSRRAFARLAADLTRIFGDRLVALVAYGPGSSVAFVRTLAADDLDACATLADAWRRDGLAAPLLMTPDEFRRSLDTFPLEYSAILDSHVVIAGHDPFAGVEIKREDLRRACEVQARGLLIHLRQGWLEAGGHAHRVEELVEHSAAPLRRLLTHVAALEGERAHDTAGLAAFAARRLALPADLVAAVLALETAPERRREVVRRLSEYLAAAERLWSFVDAWRTP